MAFNRSLFDLRSASLFPCFASPAWEKELTERQGGLCAMTVWTEQDLDLFVVSVAISPQTKCESTSSCVIAECPFTFVHTSVFEWQRRFSAAAPTVECMLVKTQSLEAHFGTRRTGHLAPVGVRLMQNNVWQGRWQLPQVGVHGRPKSGVLVGAARTLDD